MFYYLYFTHTLCSQIKSSIFLLPNTNHENIQTQQTKTPQKRQSQTCTRSKSDSEIVCRRTWGSLQLLISCISYVGRQNYRRTSVMSINLVAASGFARSALSLFISRQNVLYCARVGFCRCYWWLALIYGVWELCYWN